MTVKRSASKKGASSKVASRSGARPNEPASAVESRAERADQKRRDVLDATIRVLAREGPRAVTHRAVAAEAGTSLRATTYYFTSRDDLLTQALAHYARTALARFDAIRAPAAVTQDGDPIGVAADLLATIVLSDLVDDRSGLVAEYELVLEIGRHPALEEDYRAWQGALEEILAVSACAMGSRDPARDARIVLATLRGLEIEALARPSERPDRAELRALFHRLLVGLAPSDADLSRSRSAT